MLFNSYVFVFIFLPLTVVIFYGIGGMGHHRVAMAWLVGASLFFYGWWNPTYLGLILASILFNYGFGVALTSRSGAGGLSNKVLLSLGIVFNVGLLAYFKYANFLVDNLNALLETEFYLGSIVLPLAISFFTFQQIAYLVDAYQGETREYNFLHYCLFVVFFPQLIAGPIVHHKEMLPQFARDSIYRFSHSDFAVGVTIFVAGLFNKVVLADGVAVYATPVFEAAQAGDTLTFFEAWGGALAYTFQLYFDFSGYSNMAIGAARMLGIRLPMNFDSPYKAVNIIDFWRRWHITLSRFLRDYLYIPLGGNRRGRARRYLNLMVTMLLGGLWHGAGWTFVIWGALHGGYLVVNQGWHALRRTLGIASSGTRLGYWLARCVTFLAVVVGWVFFRSESWEGAIAMLRGMAGVNGVFVDQGYFGQMPNLVAWLEPLGIELGDLPHFAGATQAVWLVCLWVIAWFLPNSQEWLARFRPALGFQPSVSASRRAVTLQWGPALPWAVFTSALALVSIAQMTRISEFLYFQF